MTAVALPVINCGGIANYMFVLKECYVDENSEYITFQNWFNYASLVLSSRSILSDTQTYNMHLKG